MTSPEHRTEVGVDSDARLVSATCAGCDWAKAKEYDHPDDVPTLQYVMERRAELHQREGN